MNIFRSNLSMLLLIVATVFWMGCPTPPPCNTLPVINGAFYADPGGGQATNTVPVVYFNEAWMAPGDQLWLEFPCIPGSSFNVSSSIPGHIQSSRHSHLAILPPLGNKIQLSLSQTSPAFQPIYEKVVIDFKNGTNVFFTFTVNIRPKTKIPVMRGDANGNGKVDMLDLAAIAEGMFQRLPLMSVSNRPQTQPVNWVSPWGYSWKWGGLVNEVIDFAHADMNGDGLIDEKDLLILIDEIGPIDLDLFLKDGINNAEFVVKRNTTQPIICFPAIAGSSAHVEIPYTVFNSTTPIDAVLGIVHRRPLTENSCGRINSLKPELESGFFSGSEGLLGHHELWRGNNMHLENLCLKNSDVSVAVVDIGMFDTDNRKSLGSGDKIMDCIVDIDDFSGKITNGQCPIYQYDFDGILFGRGTQGGINIMPAKCSATKMRIASQDTCPSDSSLNLVIRDHGTDYGREKGPTPAAPWDSPDIIVTNLSGATADSIISGEPYNFEVQVVNLSCFDKVGTTVSLYWTEKDESNSIAVGGLNLIGTGTIPLIPLRSMESIAFSTQGLNIPTSLPSEINFIAVIGHPNDLAPLGVTSGSPFQLGPMVTNHNNVAALKKPFI